MRIHKGIWLLATAAIIAAVGSALYFILDGSDKTFTWMGVAAACMGIAGTALVFTQWKIAPLLPAICYSAAFGFALRYALPSLSDVWNKVNFIGGNAILGMVFTAVYLVCALLSAAACFTGTGREC